MKMKDSKDLKEAINLIGKFKKTFLKKKITFFLVFFFYL